MTVLKRFSALGYQNIVERRDCLFAPYAERRSSYLRKKDLLEPHCEFSKELPKEKKTLKISKIKL